MHMSVGRDGDFLGLLGSQRGEEAVYVKLGREGLCPTAAGWPYQGDEVSGRDGG